MWKLPPLILHPFSDAAGPGKLMEASRASLALQGLAPASAGVTQLEERLIEGRYCELSMLFYLGKDLERWLTQCAELVVHTPELAGRDLRPASFAAMLIESAPREVERKLFAWGVHEYKSIFARALGLHAVFDELPPRELLGRDFLRFYHRFADHLYACRQQLFPFGQLEAGEFEFELYASGEYSRMLEQQWGAA
jgi:hypothetical protein